MSKPNLVSATIATADKTAIINAAATIKSKLPFLISKTPEERQKGFKLGDGTLAWLIKTIDYAKKNSTLVPAHIVMSEWEKDTALVSDIDEILRVLKPIIENIDDTYIETGVEALGASLTFYNYIKQAAKDGVLGAQEIYNDLSTQFPGRAKKKTPPNP